MNSESDSKRDHRKKKNSKAGIFFRTSLSVLVCTTIIWFLLAGRISYATSECSKGVKQCVVGVAVALGVVDVYDKHGHCTGSGCNF